MVKNKNNQPTKKRVGKYEIIFKIIEALHLENLPKSFKGNLACDAILLIGYVIIKTEPILASFDNILTTIFNFILTLCSKELLEYKTVDPDLTNQGISYVFFTAVIMCPVIVFFLGGFQNVKEGK